MNPNDKFTIGIDGSIEYYKCANPFSVSTSPTSTSVPMNCENCAFNSNTILFDNDVIYINGTNKVDICSKESWAYWNFVNTAISEKIKSDYYMKPDPNYCQLINNPLSPTLSKKEFFKLFFGPFVFISLRLSLNIYEHRL